jgi:SAM-dependent methyltransferase
VSYLMESAAEGRRLLVQEATTPSRQRVVDAGVTAGQRVLDAGCGAGAVTGHLLDLVGPTGHVTAFDASAARVDLARQTLGPRPNLALEVRTLPVTGLPPSSFDFTWSQFVFEYLPEPLLALGELMRLTRPGGTVAIAEIDGYGLGVWPVSDELEAGLGLFQQALARARFDLFVGRKLFSAFRTLGFRDVQVRLSPFHVTAGAADAAMLDDWRVRFAALRPVGLAAFGSETAWDGFTGEYLSTLSNPDALKYAVVLTTVGTRP